MQHQIRGATEAQQDMTLVITPICGKKKPPIGSILGVKMISGSRWGSNNNNNNNNNLFLEVIFS
jgi:hypothetical protein